MRVIDFGAPASAPAAPHAACDIEDCPHCKRAAGGKLCVTTGKTVWPAMSVGGSKAMATMVLGGIAFACRFARADKYLVRPSEKEIGDLASAIREVASRRANALGAIDDLFSLLFAVGSFGRRAMMEPAPKQLAEGADGATAA